MKIKFIFFFFLILACATKLTYYQNLKTFLVYEQYPKTLSLIEENKLKEYGEKNAILYWMDKGITEHYSGDYETSIKSFSKAEKIADELFTKSISEEAASLLTSDEARSYPGEDFEQVFINVFQFLNYLFLKKYDSALVEARKIDHKFKTLQVNYGGKNVYKEDAFVRYLVGLIYEDQKEYNDAFISYRKGLKEYTENNKIYPFSIPEDLLFRSLTMAKYLRFKPEFEEITKKYNLSISYADITKTDDGEVVIIHYNGFAPYKIDHFIEISFGEGWAYVGSVQVGSDEESDFRQAQRIARSIAADEQFVVAFPKFIPVPTEITTVEFEVYDESSKIIGSPTKLWLVEDIETIAIKNLEDRIGKIYARTIARAAIKYALSRAVSQEIEKKSDELTAWLAKTTLRVVRTATEKADKRSWRLLPGKINLGTKKLSPGKYKIVVNFYNKNGSLVRKKEFNEVIISPFRKTFLPVRTSV